MDAAKLTVPDLVQRKSAGQKLVMITCYDATFARLAEEGGADILLVGDSLGMVVQGQATTLPVTLEEMLYHCRMVARGAQRALVVGDLPFGTYQQGVGVALETSVRLVKEGGVAMVKLEGGVPMADTIAAITNVDIPVMAHIGLTPQSFHRMGGHRVQGRESGHGAGQHERLLDDAKAVQEAGAAAVVLEGIPRSLAAELTKSLQIPTIGIGAGPDCDGQVLVLHDVIGLSGATFKFTKSWGDTRGEIVRAIEAYGEEVRSVRSPTTPTASTDVIHLQSAPEAQVWSDVERAEGRRVALVPTMGALHAGHLRLVDVAHEHADRVVVSIFVNPIQFNRADDFDHYPRTLASDEALCAEHGVHALYLPKPADMYPPGFQTYVEPGHLAEPLCGAGRPGHFRGVTTVVTKLFLAVRPHVAVFGQKDFQQLAIVRRMTADLDFGISVVGVPTVREDDGLALSSRNRLLTPANRSAAICVPRALDAAAAAVAAGHKAGEWIVRAAVDVLDAEPLAKVEYCELRDPDTLETIDDLDRPGLLAVAVWLGTVRLIDNRVLRPLPR